MRLAVAALLLPAAALAAGAPLFAVIPRTPDEAARVAAVTAAPADFAAPEPFEANPGSAATSIRRPDANAFSHPSAGMDFARELDFKVGNGLFRKLWVSAPASTRASDGLGPLFNARACQSCHLKDARGHPPTGPDDPSPAMLLRLSRPGAPEDLPATLAAIEGWIATRPDPVYGTQLQSAGIAGHAAEGRMAIAYADVVVALSEGETATLRRPTYGAVDLGYGPLRSDTVVSPRVAPQMIGLGLIEAIPEADILARADPEDADGDGITGRPSLVWSEEASRPMLGRFGYKAAKPTVREQTAAAFLGDIGISTPLRPEGWGECSDAQAACRAAPDGGAPEAEATVLDLVSFYSRNLAVPARRDVADPQVLAGKAAFHAAGCAACHAPKFVTDRLVGQPEQSFQLVWRPPPRRRRDGARMAHRAALGNRPHRDRHRPGELPPRRPRPHPARGDPLAWRRGADGARRPRRHAPRRACGADPLPGEPLMRPAIFAVALLLAAPATAMDHAAVAGAPSMRGSRPLSRRSRRPPRRLRTPPPRPATRPRRATPPPSTPPTTPPSTPGPRPTTCASARSWRARPPSPSPSGPTPRGATPRALAALVAAEDAIVDDPAAFRAASVAARGLLALDQLRFDAEAPPLAPGAYHCRLAVAIACDLATTAASLRDRWVDPWTALLLTAGAPDHPIWATPEEATRALLRADRRAAGDGRPAPRPTARHGRQAAASPRRGLALRPVAAQRRGLA